VVAAGTSGPAPGPGAGSCGPRCWRSARRAPRAVPLPVRLPMPVPLAVPVRRGPGGVRARRPVLHGQRGVEPAHVLVDQVDVEQVVPGSPGASTQTGTMAVSPGPTATGSGLRRPSKVRTVPRRHASGRRPGSAGPGRAPTASGCRRRWSPGRRAAAARLARAAGPRARPARAAPGRRRRPAPRRSRARCRPARRSRRRRPAGSRRRRAGARAGASAGAADGSATVVPARTWSISALSSAGTGCGGRVCDRSGR
jgi:hypothetical protein